MKKLLLPLFLLYLLTGYSQDSCNYKIQVDTESEQFTLTHEVLADYMLGKNQTVFIYFSLMKEDTIRSLVLQLSLNAAEMPPIACFNKDSRVSFELDNGSFVSLRYLGEVNCGRQSEPKDALKNSTSEAAFYIDDKSMLMLKESKLKSMRLTTMKTNFDIEFQNLISNSIIKEPVYPKEFFLNNLSCVE